MWLHKKSKTSAIEPVPEMEITKLLKLKSIRLQLYFGNTNGSNSYRGTVEYSENPRASYDESEGIEQSVEVKASSWPELRDKIDEVLGTNTN